MGRVYTKTIQSKENHTLPVASHPHLDCIWSWRSTSF